MHTPSINSHFRWFKLWSTQTAVMLEEDGNKRIEGEEERDRASKKKQQPQQQQ